MTSVFTPLITDTSFGSEHHTTLVALHGMKQYTNREIFDADRARHAEHVKDRQIAHAALLGTCTDDAQHGFFDRFGPPGCGAHVTELLPGMQVVVGRGEFRQGRPAVVRTLHASYWSGFVMVDFAGPIDHLLAHTAPEHRTKKTSQYFRCHQVPASDCVPISTVEFEYLVSAVPSPPKHYTAPAEL